MLKKLEKTDTVDTLTSLGDTPDVHIITAGHIAIQKTQSKWIIDADLSNSQLEEAFKMLESGMKPRKVAFYFGFHRSKIRAK